MNTQLPEKIDLSKVRIDPAYAMKVPANLAMRRLALPICVVDGELAVAMADTQDTATLAAIERAAGTRARAISADAQSLRAELLKVYGDSRNQASASHGDPVAIVDDLLRSATIRQASDIHIDPNRDGLRIRLRVDGIIEDFMAIGAELQPAVISRLKVMAGLDIAEKRAPQDGAFVWNPPRSLSSLPPAFDVRVATLPVRFGERITLRLLESGQQRLTLESLGMSETHLAQFRAVLSNPHGLVLLTGPTGSGKTTTLYASIRHLLNNSRLNILTVEDPVEYEIDEIAQVEVESSDKVNFSKALRSLLRHDPDVVMIGEIRDAESLDTAVKSALTGHLVLSTLHTNDAASTVTRLADMGLAPHLIAATLRLSAAQRLVRRLCPHCRRPAEITPEQAFALGDASLAGKTACAPHGCLACAGRGYSGRIGLFETIAPDHDLAALIASGAHEGAITDAIAQKGGKKLMDDAVEKILSGATSIQEVLRTVTSGGAA